MSNPSKQRGTAFESLIVAYLKSKGFDGAERRTLSGSKDRGDISGVCSFAIEAKATKAFEPAAFVDEAKVEAVNAGVPYHLVVVKRRMKGIDQAYALMTFGQAVELLTEYLDLKREVELQRRAS